MMTKYTSFERKETGAGYGNDDGVVAEQRWAQQRYEWNDKIKLMDALCFLSERRHAAGLHHGTTG